MKIPTYTRQQDIQPASLPMVNPEAMTADLTALQRMGAHGQELSAALMARNEQLAKEQDKINYAKTINDYNSRQINYIEDPTNGIKAKFKEDLAIGVVDNTRTYLKQEKANALKNVDKRILEAVSARLDSENNKYLHELSLYEAGERVKATNKAMDSTIANAKTNAVRVAYSPVLVAEEIDSAIETLNILSPTGNIGEDKELLATDSIVASAIETAINNGDVKSARTLLNNYKDTLNATRRYDDLAKKIDAGNKDKTVTEEILEIKTSPQFKDEKTGEFDFTKALRYIESPEFLAKVKDHRVVESAAISLSRNQNLENNIYKQQADETKGNLQVDILEGKLDKDNLPKDNRWLSLRSSDRAVITNFAEAKNRADRAEATSERSLNLQTKQVKKQEQQEEAIIFRGKTFAKIANGEYLDVNQIIKDHTVDNPYIQSNLASTLATFKAIESAPELRTAITQINKAATQGLLDSDYKNNLLKKGELITELRNKYMTEQDFRGDKVNQWVKTKVDREVKNGIIEWFKSVWSDKSEAKGYSQADLEYTAKKHGISVEEVKRRLEKK